MSRKKESNVQESNFLTTFCVFLIVQILSIGDRVASHFQAPARKQAKSGFQVCGGTGDGPRVAINHDCDVICTPSKLNCSYLACRYLQLTAWWFVDSEKLRKCPSRTHATPPPSLGP